MKFIISLLIGSSAWASPIVIFHESNQPEAQIYQKILIDNYHVPEELISIQNVKKCERAKGLGKLDLCLKNNGDLVLVSVDVKFINESVKIFRAP